MITSHNHLFVFYSQSSAQVTIEGSDNPGGTFQFKNNTAISIQVSFKKHKFGLEYTRMYNAAH